MGIFNFQFSISPHPARYASAVKTVTINAGRAIVYRLFDIADEIDLARIGAGSSRVNIARGGAQVIVREAPVSIALGTIAIRLGTRFVEADTYARAWNYGAVSLQFHINLKSGMTWDDLVQLAALAEDDNDVDAVAAARLIEVRTSIASALKAPHEPAASEDYIIYLLQSIEGSTPSHSTAVRMQSESDHRV